MDMKKMLLLQLCALFHVTVGSQIEEVAISPPGKEVFVLAGSAFQFTCACVGSCKTPQFRWTRASTDSDGTLTKNGTLKLSNVTLEDEGPYTCEAKCDGSSEKKRTTVKMTVYAFSQPVLVMPIILMENVASDVTCSVDAFDHVDHVHINWYLGSELLKNESQQPLDAAKVTDTLTLTPLRAHTGKKLTCEVKADMNNNSKQSFSYLDIHYAPKVNISASSSGMEEEEVVMSCTGDGHPAPTIEWEKKGEIWPKNLHRHTQGIVTGRLHRSNQGVYQCVAKNMVSEAKEEMKLEVQYGPANTSIQAFSLQAMSYGVQLNLTCLSDMQPKAKQYVWTRIPGMALPKEAVVTNSHLIIENFQEHHQGIYECRVIHHSGNTERAFFTASVQAETKSTQLVAAVTGSLVSGITGGIVAGFMLAKWLE
ncbi:vascular cell adhesion protein 1 isoform X1 [Coregonus clupeaformis]|uniref:vascular cell adhesion protein 1 isoform X1 n=1 Tax=Coregonus clupeaformis TaxID=59861 RepID=UPI001BE01266|nr:vascular cell adhesion protein 1 isoform X1 [Coregonus clupeaformis]